MNIRTVVLIIVGFLLGALAAGSIGVRVIREVGTEEEATSLPPSVSSTTVAPSVVTFQVDPNETIISSTALIPTAVEAADGSFRISYELESLAPRAGVPPIEFFAGFGVITTIEPEAFDHVYPRQWVVTTTEGEFEGGPANAASRAASFDVAEGFAIGTVERILITEAFAPYPAQVPFELSASEPTADVSPGVSMELLNVSEQGATTIVQIGINIDDPELAGFFVRGDGPGWRSAFFEAEGRPRVNLTWADGPLPDPIPLLALGTLMVPLDGTFEVTLDGLGSR